MFGSKPIPFSLRQKPLAFFQLSTILSLLLLVGVARATNDPDEAEFNPDPRSVRIESFGYSGTGCPAGSVLGDISPDNEVITLLFSQYAVEKRANEQAGQKNCNMQFRLSAPAGWSHAVMSMNVQGYADLEGGLTGIQNLSYGYADGTGRNKLGQMRITGPYTDDYTRSEEIPLQSLDWSKCDRGVNQVHIQSSIAIRPAGQQGRRAVGLMTTDVIENVLEQGVPGRMNQQFTLLWRKCPKAGEPAKKSNLAVCRVRITERGTGKLIRQVNVKARAKNAEQALRKAQRKAQQRCQNVSRGPGRGRAAVAKDCSWSASQCARIQL